MSDCWLACCKTNYFGMASTTTYWWELAVFIWECLTLLSAQGDAAGNKGNCVSLTQIMHSFMRSSCNHPPFHITALLYSSTVWSELQAVSQQNMKFTVWNKSCRLTSNVPIEGRGQCQKQSMEENRKGLRQHLSLYVNGLTPEFKTSRKRPFFPLCVQ